LMHDHATSEIASGSKLDIDATKKLPGEGFKRPWPPLIKMDAAVKAKVEKTFWRNRVNPRRWPRTIPSPHGNARHRPIPKEISAKVIEQALV